MAAEQSNQSNTRGQDEAPSNMATDPWRKMNHGSTYQPMMDPRFNMAAPNYENMALTPFASFRLPRGG